MFKVSFYNDMAMQNYILNLERSELRRVEKQESLKSGTYLVFDRSVLVCC